MKNTYVKNTYEVIKVWSMGGGKKSDIYFPPINIKSTIKGN